MTYFTLRIILCQHFIGNFQKHIHPFDNELFSTLKADQTEGACYILAILVMHNAASSGRASSVNFLYAFNRPFIFSISSGTNNARLAAMLRQLAQYHAKDPNNLFMVRLAQVGGNTKGTLYQTVCLSDY